MRRLFSLLICAALSTVAFAQETDCGNGLDDDNDGFIDCYDPDCANFSACDDIFIGNDATCTLEPPPAPAFTMKLDFASENETTNHFSRMAIGDLDGDKMPEIITMNKYTKKLIVLNGNDGSIKYSQTLTAGATPEWEIAIANIDKGVGPKPDCAEIFFLGTDSKIYVYDCELTFLYSTNAMPGSNDPINFGLADFDGDGKTEIYCKDQIFDAHSGRRLVATTNAANWNRLNGGPVAVDMTGSANLELVLGLTIYQVNIPVGRGTDAGSLTVLASRPEYFTRNVYNATSVADYNQDGFLDVIASGSTGCNGKNTTIFFWDRNPATPAAQALKTYSDHNSINGDSDYETGWQNGTGRVNIADLDGDGELNLSYVSGGFLYALKEDMTRLWRVSINEETSGYTGCTLFDFNGDGKSEIVYRDEQYLYIIDGTDGSIFNQQNCVSRTNREYPIVADVDADGATEICVTCGFDDALALANFTTTSYSQYSHVRVFESASPAEPWVPARRVWNQHGYFVVNVNDDLTIPIRQQSHGKEFSTWNCATNSPGTESVRPLNKFLNQSPFIDTNGCPAYLSPNITIIDTSIDFDPPTCPDLDFDITFQFQNEGEVAFTGDLPVSFYTSNPLYSGAQLLGTITISVNDLGKGDTPITVNHTLNSNGSDSLFIAINDAGTTVPTPIVLPNTPLLECDYDNVRGIAIAPRTVAITALPVAPHELCASPPTGAVRAFVNVGGVENTADYDFYWFDGATAGAVGTEDFKGPIYSGIVNGPYQVYAIHKTASCSSDTTNVNVASAPGILPVVTVNVLHDQTSCNPPNGQLEAVVAGGNSGYTFQWFVNASSLGITTSVASGLVADNYQVVVSRNGCTVDAPGVVIKTVFEPDVNVSSTPVTNCQNPNSGTVTASALIGGVVQPSADYTFEWYFYDNASSTRGSILPPLHGTGPTRTGLPVGFYEVVVTNNTTFCTSIAPVTVEIVDQTISPVVTISELAPQTSCDPANPNGRLQATVTLGGVPVGPAGLTYEWFVGQNTLPANLHTNVSGVSGSIAEKVKAGGQAYTLKVTTSTQCSGTDDATITEDINVPIVTLASDQNGICDANIATSNFTGEVRATVTFDGSNVTFPNAAYTFQWYNGTQAIGATRPENAPTISQLDSGFYTVVVTNTTLGCKSTPETEEVTNTTVLPDIDADANGSTNCSPTLDNGGVQVTDVDGAGTPAATYNFEWHRGNTIAGYLIASTAVSPDTLQGASGRFYTVLVTRKSDGCRNTETVEVPDDRELPTLSLDPTPNGICNPSLTVPPKQFGGIVDATVTNQGTNPIADYRFTWTDEETGTQVLQATGLAGQSLLDRDSSYYTAVVLQLSTGCQSNPVTVEVTPLITLPLIAADANASTNCVPSLANGGVQVNLVDGAAPGAAHTFQWRRGNTFTGYNVANAAVSLDTLQGGATRFYTVQVTRLSDGCQNTRTVQVPDDRQLPVITLSSTDNTKCTGVPDGTASLATLLDRGVNVPGPGFAGYTFGWEGGVTTATLPNKAAGNYSLKVRSNATGCASDSVSIDVGENFFIPPINIAANNQTSCDNSNPNGNLAATIDETMIGGGAAVTAGYSFAWVNNNNPFATPGTGAGTTATISNLRGNLFYTVTVTRTLTGCDNTESIFLPEIITYPIVAAAVGNNVTRCDTPDGSVIANVGGLQNGFTFFWLNEVGSNQTADDTTVMVNADATFINNGTYPGLTPGYYTVVARDNNTFCPSQPVTRQIIDATVQTTLTITPGPVFPSTCGAADGQMTGTVAGGVGPFTMFWHYTGPINDSINFFDNPPEFTPPNDVPFATIAGGISNLTNLESRLYTLVVQDNGNGCGNYETIFLPFVNAHSISTNITPSTICPYNVGNGEIDVTVGNIIGGTFQDYTYKIYNGENPDPLKQLGPTVGPGGAVTNPQVYTALAPGMYTIEVRQDLGVFGSNCPVYDVVEIEAHALSPLVDITGTAANTACDIMTAADGSASIRINKATDDLTTGFTYSIVVNPAPLGWVNPSPTGPYPPVGLPELETITGLSPSNVVAQYDITVTSSNNCVTQKFISISNQPAVAQILGGNVTALPALYCDPALEVNASAEVTALSIINGPADNISDYEFSWFTNAGLTTAVITNQDGVTGAGKGGEVLSNVGAPLPGSPVTVGSYWVVATKEDVGTTGGVGCFSAPFRVDITDATVNPVFTLVPTDNTACDTDFEGSLRLTVTNPGSVASPTYTYDWAAANPFDIEGGGGPVAGNDGDGSNADGDGDNPGTPHPPTAGLPEGLYLVNVENDVTGCRTNGQATILKATTAIIITDATPTPQMICDPDGMIQVNSVTVAGIADPVMTNFDFSWYINDPNSVPVINAVNGESTLDISNLPTIGAGSYFVKAKRSANVPLGSGCESAPFQVEITDQAVDPAASLTALPNTACNTNFEGSLQVSVTDPGSAPAALNYTYTWTAFTPGIPAPAVANGDGVGADDNFGSLPDDTNPYVLEIENNSSGCKTTVQATITKSAVPIIVASTTKTDQTVCAPLNGSIQVQQILVGGVPDGNFMNFDFTWYRNDLSTEIVASTQNNSLLDNTDPLNAPLTMGAGSYFVKVIRRSVPIGSGCESAPVRVDLLDISRDPDVDITAVAPNSSCDPGDPNGVVLANAFERDATVGTYTFSWTLDGGALHASTIQNDASPTSQLTSATQGDYAVEVTNTATNCRFTQGITLIEDLSISLPSIVLVNTVDPVNCFPTGSAEVGRIIIGGTTTFNNPPDDIDTNFDYEWYSGTVPGGLIAGQQNSDILNLLPGTYFVLVEDLTTSCTSSLIEVFIDSASIVYPVVAIQQTAPQASCNAAFGTGVLAATADGQNDTNPNYSFTWFPSLDLTGSSFANTSTINGLFSGEYSVRAFNALTNCSSSALFILQNDSTNFFPKLALSSNPLTECDSIDGSISARGIPFAPIENYPFALYNYTVDLYVGAPPADINTPEFPNVPNDPNAPGFTSNFLQVNLPDGPYTVRMTDNNTGCISIGTVDVEDERVYPVPAITQVAPVTNCDLSNPNGVARALVNGTFVGYSFEWFEGTIPAGSPVYVGPEFGEVKMLPTQYVVRATNLVTGCSDSTVLSNMASALAAIPVPTVTVTAVTSCDELNPNGILAANVNGNTAAYDFRWYDGTLTTQPVEVPDPGFDFIGEIYDSLASAFYGVTATSRITGCKSPLKVEFVPIDQEFPEIDFDIVKALCGMNNGSISLTITSDIAIDTVQWYFGFFDENGNPSGTPVPGAEGPLLSEALAGDYSVLVTTILGCKSFENVTLDTEIHPFNGISRGSTPNVNDYFHIDCIDNFPKNVVRIYNRAGTLVYEGHGYDNVETYFDGKSNKGVSPMGTNLPDGTYFYVVDKNDGSKALAGYIEIVK